MNGLNKHGFRGMITHPHMHTHIYTHTHTHTHTHTFSSTTAGSGSGLGARLTENPTLRLHHNELTHKGSRRYLTVLAT